MLSALFIFCGEALGETCIGAIAMNCGGALKARLTPLLPVIRDDNKHIERAARLAHLKASRSLLAELERNLLERALKENGNSAQITGRDPEFINASTYLKKAHSACAASEKKYRKFEEQNVPVVEWRAAVGRARPQVEIALNGILGGEAIDDELASAFVEAALAEIAAAGWHSDAGGEAMTIIRERFLREDDGYVAAYESFIAEAFKEQGSKLKAIWEALELAEIKQHARFSSEALARLETQIKALVVELKDHITSDGDKTRLELREVKALVHELIEKGSGQSEAPKLDPSSEEFISETIEGLLEAGEGARKRAANKVTATPPDIDGALSELKQFVAQQEDGVADTAKTYREIGALALLKWDTFGAIDAWKRVAELTPSDADAHNQLGHLYNRIGDLDRAVIAYKKVLSLGNSQANKKLIAVANGNLGLIEATRGDLDAAVEYQKNSLAIHKELENKEGMAPCYGNLGIIERKRGDFDKAVEYYEKALAIDIELGRKEGMAIRYGNLGVVEQMRDNLDIAFVYSERALEIDLELGHKEGMAARYGNLGIIERKRGNLDAAVEYYEKSLAIDSELGRKEGVATTFSNLGIIEYTRGNLDAAVEYYGKALALFIELDAKEGMALNCKNLGIAEEKRGDMKKACENWRLSVENYHAMGVPQHAVEIEGWIAAQCPDCDDEG